MPEKKDIHLKLHACCIRPRLVFLALFICLIATLVPSVGQCNEDPRVDDVTVERDSPLSISFIVKNAFNEDIEEAVDSGIPTSFTFIVELARVRGLWFDKHAGSWRFKHTVKYDTLKEEYEIILEEKGGKVLRTKDTAEMKRIMTTVVRNDLKPVSPLLKGRDYSLRIKAELHTIKLPFLLDYVLFFIKFLDFETDWFTYRFTL